MILSSAATVGRHITVAIMALRVDFGDRRHIGCGRWPVTGFNDCSPLAG
jgi:hypothetical protein